MLELCALRSQPGSIAATIRLLRMEYANRRLYSLMSHNMRKMAVVAAKKLEQERRTMTAQERAAVALAKRRQQEALGKLLRQRKEYMQQQKMIRELKSRSHGVMVENEGPVDVVRDIMWVYRNIGELIQTHSDGTRELRSAMLSTAPSQGAVAFAEYARDDFKSFFDKYVKTLLPKDISKKDRSESDEQEKKIKEMDPGLEDLDEYMGGISE